MKTIGITAFTLIILLSPLGIGTGTQALPPTAVNSRLPIERNLALKLQIPESEIDPEIITDDKPRVTADNSHQSAPISAEKPDRDATFNNEATFCNNSGVEKPLLR